MDESDLIMMIQLCQKTIDLMSEDKDDISKCLGGTLCREYLETVKLEILALNKVKKNLEDFQDQYYFKY